MNSRSHRASARTWLALLLAAVGSAAFADADLEEVVVTAQRRSESLQTVPIAITAVSAADMERNGIHELGTLAQQVPGLTFSPFSPGQNIISLRGVSSNDDGAGTDNSVGVFIDDVYHGRVSNINAEMFDVDRVEVLRGPQGTLYGKNTIGGAINIVSSTPNKNELDAKFRADIGNFGRHDFSGLVTGPLVDGWAGKLVVSTRQADGWVNNVALHTQEKNDDDRAVRGQVLRTGAGSELLLSADYEQLNVGDMARTPLTHMTNNLPFNLLAGYQTLCGTGPNPSCAANPSDGYTNRYGGGVSAKYTDHVDSFSDLISVTAYRHSYIKWAMDSLGAVFPLSNDVHDTSRQVSEELRWVSAPSERLNYVAGLWFMRENTDRLRVFLLPSVDPTVAGNDRYRGIDRTTSYAGFGQVNWAFVDRWTLTAGGRYSSDKKQMDNDAVHGVNGIFNIIPNTFANSREASWGKFTPKLAIRFEPNDSVNLYATVAQGFKSGGFAASPTSVGETNPLLPEQATNVELGAKVEIARRVRANVAVFDTHYKDLQIQSFGPPPNCAAINSCFGVFETFNAGSAEAKGAELEFIWLPLDDLTVSATYGYLHAKFTNVYLPNASVYQTVSGQAIDLRNQSGQDMLRAPRNKGSLDVKYDLPLGAKGRLETSANYSYTADQRGELEPYAIQPAYSLIDARLGWVSPSSQYQVSLWGRNLANKAWISHVYTIADEVLGVYGEPRTYGLTFSWHLHP
jgi:iron complex outermembrane receptor protein